MTCLLLAVVAAPPATADEPELGALRVEMDGAPLPILSVDVDDHPQVTVTVTTAGSGVSGPLPELRLTEDGRPLVSQVKALPGHAHELAILLDTSGSMDGGPLNATRAVLHGFIAQAPPGMRIALVTFSSDVQVHSPLSLHRSRLGKAVDDIAAGGRTALYDGVVVGMGLFSDRPDIRRTVVLLADGEDNASRSSHQEALQALASSDVVLHAIELDTPGAEGGALEGLAGASGGQVVTTSDADQLAGIFTSLLADITAVYEVTFLTHDPSSDADDASADDRAVPSTSEHPGPLVDDDFARGEPLGSEDGSHLLLIIGVMAAISSLVVVATRVIFPKRPPSPFGDLHIKALAHTAPARSRAQWLEGLVGAVLDHRGRRERLATTLQIAGVGLRPAEFVILTGAGMLLVASLGVLLRGPVFALLGAAMVPAGVRVALKVKTRKRRAAFADQLDDTLQLLAGSLRAGHSLLQAVDAVSREAESPTSEEFRRIVNVTRVGQDLTLALKATVDRTASEDLAWVAHAVSINREVGGDLGEVLDTVAHTIRERNQLRRQVKALSAEGKLSALVLMALPIGVLGFLRLTNPGYLAGFGSSLAGMAMLATAFLLMLVGGLWLNRLVRIQF